MIADKLRTQRDAARAEYEARSSSAATLPVMYGLVMQEMMDQSRQAMDSLTPEQQEIVKQVGRDTMGFYGEKLMASDESAMVTLTQGDDAAELVELTEAEYARVAELAQPSIEKWKNDMSAVGSDGDAMMAELYALIDKWTQVMETEGLPWERK